MHPGLSSNCAAKGELEVLVSLPPLPPARRTGMTLQVYSALRTEAGVLTHWAGSPPEELPPQSQCDFSIRTASSDLCHRSLP